MGQVDHLPLGRSGRCGRLDQCQRLRWPLADRGVGHALTPKASGGPGPSRGDRWGRLRLTARSWGNAPPENRTFGDLLKLAAQKKVQVPPTTGLACVRAGVETCLARFSIGRKYAPDGAVSGYDDARIVGGEPAHMGKCRRRAG
jgi:hypothetical protein